MLLRGWNSEKKGRLRVSKRQKVFILVRRDLSPAQRAVHACHALAELMDKHEDDL